MAGCDVSRRAVLGLVLALCIASASAVCAQMSPAGSLEGRVTDPRGGMLPGVMVTLIGVGPERRQPTDTRGQFRFLALAPGTYRIVAELDGFGHLEVPDVSIGAGRATTLGLALPRTVEESIRVVAEAPLLDEGHIAPGTTVTREDLEKIPTAQDPFALLRQTPGVFLDRVDVAGNESANETSFRGAAVDQDQNDFQIDGISITSTWTLGTSIYYDMDQFAEVRYSTGGSDVTQRTSGVSVNMVTRRGSNRLRSSARANLVDGDGTLGVPRQASTDLGPADLGPGQVSFSGRRIDRIQDAGVEAGGALIRDRLWLWGSLSQNDIANIEPNTRTDGQGAGIPTDTSLVNASTRLDLQLTSKNSMVASWSGSSREEFNQGAGTGYRAPEAFNDEDRDVDLFRLEDTHIFSPRLFLTFLYGWGGGGPRWSAHGGAGADAPEVWHDLDGNAYDNWHSGWARGEGRTYRIDASRYLTTGTIDHELKLGGHLRQQQNDGDWHFPGRDLFTLSPGVVIAYRGTTAPIDIEQGGVWAQDTLRWGRLTLNVGLRFDRQKGDNRPGSIPANPAFPDVLPAVEFPGTPTPFTWRSWSPRVGVTWALGAERRTLLRVSYAQFADQLGRDLVAWNNPLGRQTATLLYGGGAEQYGNEPAFVFTAPGDYESLDPVDPHLRAPTTSEIIFSVDHAIRPNLVVSASLTGRNVRDILDNRRLVRDPDGTLRPLRAEEWVQAGRVSGTVPGSDYTYDLPLYELPGGALRVTDNFELLNGSRERDYAAATLSLTKRLSHRFMARGFATWGRGEWKVPQDFLDFEDPNRSAGGGDRDGDLFFTSSGAPLGTVLSDGINRGARNLQATWRLNGNGMVRIAPDKKWGLDVAGNVTYRQGYPLTYTDCGFTLEPLRRCTRVTEELDDFRLDNVFLVDLRLQKEIVLRSGLLLNAYVDAFNLTNDTTVQSRYTNLDGELAQWVRDTVNPRVYRLGMRLSWR